MSSPSLEQSSVRVFGPELEPGHASGGLLKLWTHRRLLYSFVLRDLRHRYLGSSIGFFWTVITPLLELVTYTFVFHAIIGIQFGGETQGWSDYALFLFCGMVTWMSFSDGLSRCSSVIVEHGQLVKKVNFPMVVLPGHVIASGMLNQIIRLGVLLAAAVVIGQGLSWTLLLVPFIVVAQAMMTLGAGLLLACAGVYFRDTAHWINAILLMWMFITPIFYPAEALAETFNLILQLNPMSHVVGVYRELILNQTLPDPRSLIIIVVVSGLTLLIGHSVFHHHRYRFADLV